MQAPATSAVQRLTGTRLLTAAHPRVPTAHCRRGRHLRRRAAEGEAQQEP